MEKDLTPEERAYQEFQRKLRESCPGVRFPAAEVPPESNEFQTQLIRGESPRKGTGSEVDVFIKGRRYPHDENYENERRNAREQEKNWRRGRK